MTTLEPRAAPAADLGDPRAVEWCHRELASWLEGSALDAEATEIAFRHAIPFALVDLARSRGDVDIELPAEETSRLSAPSSRVSGEELERLLRRWVSSHDEAYRDVVSAVVGSRLPPVLLKGGVFRRLGVEYRRFSNDIDLWLDSEGALPFIEKLCDAGYQPVGPLCFVDREPRSALAELGKGGRRSHATIEVGVRYLDSHPSDMNTLHDHPFLQGVADRAVGPDAVSPLRTPNPTDWLLCCLIEMTTNHGLRLRDIIDIATFLRELRAEVDWDRLVAEAGALGLVPYWIATAEALGRCGLDSLVDPVARLETGARGTDRRLAALLVACAHPKVLTRGLLPASAFLFRTRRERRGRLGAAEEVVQALARELVKRFSGSSSTDLMQSRVLRRILFPATPERRIPTWTIPDLRRVLHPSSGPPRGPR